MIAKAIKLVKNPSKFGGYFYYIFFKDENGKSYKTCVGSTFRNFRNWQEIVVELEDNELWLNGLQVKADGLIDADSVPFKCLSPTEEQKQGQLDI